MNNYFWILILCFIPFYNDAQECKNWLHNAHSEIQHYKSLSQFTEPKSMKNYDVTFQHLKLNVDPDSAFIAGSIYSEFSVKEEFSKMYFDCSPNLIIDSIVYDSDTLNFTVLVDKKQVQINFSNSLNLGSAYSLTIFYHGKPNSTGNGSFIQSEHDSVPIIWTLSEPYGARDWWPCKQSLNDKIDSIKITLSYPDGYFGVSNGMIQSVDSTSSINTITWKHNYPIPAYLIAIAVTNYTFQEDVYISKSGVTFPIHNYLYPETFDENLPKLERTLDAMHVFDSLFEVYPFHQEKYGHAQFGWGGGMEHTTISFMGGFGKNIIQHELAHQWFGNKITCGSWKDIWLNEGFATYCSGIAYQVLTGEEVFMDWKRNYQRDATDLSGGSIYVEDTTSVSRVFNYELTYAKAAYVLHMLRYKLGDELFFKSVQQYLADSSLSFSYAKTNQLLQHFEKTTQQNLQEFFDDWIYGQGFPSYTIEWSYKNELLTFTINQQQSHASVDFFEMPVQLLIHGESIDSLLQVENTQNEQTFEIPIPFKVKSIEFDPELNILSRSNSVRQVVTINENSPGVKIISNPSQQYISVQSFLATDPIREVYIWDTSLRLLFYEKFEANSLSEIIRLNNVPKGIYFVQTKTEQITSLQKVSNVY